MLYDIDVRFFGSSEANWKLKRNLARMSDATGIKVFGDSTLFAFECIHEPIPNEHGHVYGRMCIRSNNQVLGDFEAPACMLNVTAAHLEEVLRRSPELKTDMFSGQDDITVGSELTKPFIWMMTGPSKRSWLTQIYSPNSIFLPMVGSRLTSQSLSLFEMLIVCESSLFKKAQVSAL
jgi:hypothetical protein